ncbi:hypothetical protein I4F81_010922 [Pyropia yezoensis]|uniref:Uncharacterized protein n=1 Tax=Pyropia yezoensis TaxID=2788 RepID=A0ACC3CEB6_PYRYE|nr:hypothetical protein I4F81_010922 [Neopyropia yezoensis]
MASPATAARDPLYLLSGARCPNKGGACGDVASCSGTVVSNLCPGGKTNKCCIPADSRCPDKGGACRDVSSCSGTVVSNLCPGGKTNKCCIPTDRRCPDKGGACGNVASCTGTVVSNLCPGEASNNYSNHSWGTAIDIQVAGRTDAMGDDAVYAGLAALYPHFEAEGWYWGAGFRREDAMHFEVSDERVREWAAAGLLDM